VDNYNNIFFILGTASTTKVILAYNNKKLATLNFLD